MVRIGLERRFILLARLLATLLVVAGCGARPTDRPMPSAGARVVVRWPQTGRLIPTAANSIRVEIKNGQARLATAILDRPTDGSPSSASFDGLPAGVLALTAAAYPEAGARGTALAQASDVMTTRPGENTTVRLTLASTVQQVEVAPANGAVLTGRSLQLTAAGRNAAGETVLLAPGKLTWRSESPTIASVGAGTVTGIAAGSARITVTDSETGKSGTAVVTVSARALGLAKSPWPKFHADAANTGRGQGSGATGVMQWECVLGDWTWRPPVIGADGSIYVMSTVGHVYAVDGASGTQRWSFVMSAGYNSTPAIGADGSVYAADVGMWALDAATGAIQQHWNDFLYGPVAFGLDGTILVGGTSLSAFDGATGGKKWGFPVQVGYGCPAVGADGTIYIGAGDKKVYALDGATGAKKWEFLTGGAVGSPAVGADGTVYAVSTDKKVYALDGTTGLERWEFATENLVYESSPTIGTDGTVYVTTDKLYALDGATGAEKWSFRGYGDCAIAADGTVYVQGWDGLCALDGTSGTQKWVFRTGPVASRGSPAIGADGTIYVASGYRLYAIR